MAPGPYDFRKGPCFWFFDFCIFYANLAVYVNNLKQKKHVFSCFLHLSVLRGHPSLKSPRECLCHVRPPCRYTGASYFKFVTIETPSAPPNEPKYAQTNQICLCPCSNRLERGYLSLKSPRKCLRYIRLVAV